MRFILAARLLFMRRCNSRDLIIERLAKRVAEVFHRRNTAARGDFHFVLITRSAALYFGRPRFSRESINASARTVSGSV